MVKKNIKTQSIVKKLISRVGFAILLLVLILISSNFFISKKIAFNEKVNYIEASAQNKSKEIELIFDEAYYELKTFEKTVNTIKNDESISKKREVIENIAKEIVINNENVVGIGIGFNKNAFDNKDALYVGIDKYGEEGQFFPYITYLNNELNIQPLIGLENENYYLEAKNAKRDVLIEPYEFKVNNQNVLMTNISVPLYDKNNKFIGILGIDMLLESIQQKMEEELEENIEEEYYFISNSGIIVANDTDSSKVGESIIKYYPNFEKNKIEMDNVGSVSRYSELNSSIYKVNLKTTFGELNAKWYLLANVENSVIFAETYRNSLIIIVLSLLFSVISAVLLAKVIRNTIRPVVLLSDKMKELDINDVRNTKFDLEETELIEVDVLIRAYKEIIENLKDNFKIRDKKEKLQLAQVKISNLIQSDNKLDLLGKDIITEVTKEVNGQIGALYIENDEEKEETYKLFSSYAYIKRKGINTSYKIGEGLIGQAALEKELIIISEIPKDYIAINSGLGKSEPKNIVIVPCVFNDEVIAILEIGFINEIGDVVIEYLETIRNSVAIALKNIKNNEYNKFLLDQTMEQSIELQHQQEELRVSNEELEEQTETLKKSQVELETQQEELRVINEELESNAQQMKLSKKEVERKNDELEIAQKEIEGKANDLELSNKYKSEFLANMSHELRTPLNSILILSELLENNPRKTLGEKDIEFAKTINTSGKDLLNLINDILDLSKVEAGKEELEIAEMNIEELISEMLALFNPVAMKSNVKFITETDDKLPIHIMTDKQKIKQIIKNLLSNAFKFTKDGTVTLKLSLEESKLLIQIIDTGVGIEKDKVNSIFDAFKQEDGSISRKFGGTGLGLSISKEYAKLLGGNIEIESEKEKGSIFSLIIPIRYKKKEERNKKVKKISNDTINKLKSSIDTNEVLFESQDDINYIQDDRRNIEKTDDVILIVDDDSNFAEVVLELVRNGDYKAIVAETGEAALFLADYYLPKGIILDIGLPKMDGYEVTKKLKMNNRTKDIPVYIISGKGKDNNQNMDGILKYYQKPITPKQIEEILNKTSEISSNIKNILVIEDNEIQRNSVVELIKNDYNYITVDSCESGATALEKLKLKRYDLIILDLGLEDYKEFEFIEVLKGNEEYKNIPIIVNTGEDISRENELKLRKKVSDIIIKDDVSTRRLLDEIKLFVHKVEDGKISDFSELFTNKTILVVDDDMRNIFALSSILETSGINVEIATNGKEGINVLKNNKNIDLVLMDIMMPEMNGYEAMKIIRETEGIKDISIIALTAKAMKGDRDKCIEAGANEYLSKPIDREKLLSLLRVWL
ncbi:response regulator [Clostridiaceae bacterium HSG29]|nr:response regulator [Clostridiaceae bacterium HSG29]